MTDIPKMLRAEALVADEDWTGIYQISPDLAFAAADRIEKLERDVLKYSSAVADAQMRNEELDRALNRIIDRWEAQKARIEKLEAALREIAALGFWDGDSAMSIARKALEGKDD